MLLNSFLNKYVWVVLESSDTLQGQRSESEELLESQVVMSYMVWMLGTEPQSSARPLLSHTSMYFLF